MRKRVLYPALRELNGRTDFAVVAGYVGKSGRSADSRLRSP
ncbi:hypothetical protein [Pseudomonas helleri]